MRKIVQSIGKVGRSSRKWSRSTTRCRAGGAAAGYEVNQKKLLANQRLPDEEYRIYFHIYYPCVSVCLMPDCFLSINVPRDTFPIDVACICSCYCCCCTGAGVHIDRQSATSDTAKPGQTLWILLKFNRISGKRHSRVPWPDSPVSVCRPLFS